MSIEEIRRRAGRFQNCIWWRNAMEYTAAAAVVVVFALFLKWFPGPVARAGAVLMIAAALYVAYQLHRRGSVVIIPSAASFDDCLSFHRRQLERQRDAVKSIWSWYLGPFVPGFVILTASKIVETSMPLPHRILGAALMLAVVAPTFWVATKLNQRAARRLQAQIDRLRTLEG